MTERTARMIVPRGVSSGCSIARRESAWGPARRARTVGHGDAMLVCAVARATSGRAWAGRRSMLMIALALLSRLAFAQEDAETYRNEADKAIDAQSYEHAVNVLKEAQARYPDDPEFFSRLGDLYYDEKLYALALGEYQQAERRAPSSYPVLESIAYTLGLLNREAESASYWSQLHVIYPDRIEPVQNLGWLDFKLHRLDGGVALLTDAWNRFGPDADIAMTLGTLNAELYRLPDATTWYERSIELSGDSSDGSGGGSTGGSFASVAYYNLSLIQKLFHRYEDALASTEKSLAILSRPTGYLARGEIRELTMDFHAAEDDYLKAYQMDDETPLARLNLAILYQRFGRLDQALAFASSVIDETDRSWLYYYGTDVTRHLMELHDLFADLYEGLANTERVTPVTGPIAWLSRAWTIGRDRVLSWYHRSRFSRYAGEVGERVLEGGNPIDGNWYLYRANEHRPRVGAVFLARARSLEVSAIPDAAHSYASEEAKLHGDTTALLALAPQLTSPWERQLLEETLIAALEGARRHDALWVDAATRLYAINPGALRQHHIALPVRFSVRGVAPRIAPRIARRLTRLLSHAGFTVVDASVSRAALLDLSLAEGSISARLQTAEATATARASYTGLARRALVPAVVELADSIFAVQ